MTECRARLRSHRAHGDPCIAEIRRLLAQVETDPDALVPTRAPLVRLAATDRRNALVSYLRLSSLTQERGIMNRPRTTGHLTDPSAQTMASPAPDAAISIGQSLLALVVVVEGKPSAGPAVKAYQTAIRRKGEEAAATGGSQALEDALRVVIDADPDRAQQRERLVSRAWDGLPGWRT